MENDEQYFLSGLFNEMGKAEKAYSALLSMGYKPEEVNVAMASTTRDKLHAADLQIGTPKPEPNTDYDGTIDGGITGGLLGSIALTIGAFGSNLFIPGLGLVLMGPLAAGLLGAGAGGLTGGIIGKMLSPGVPEPQSELITQGLKNGKIMLALVPHNVHDEKVIHAKWTALDAEIIQNQLKTNSMTEHKNKLFPFAWVLLALVIMAFIAYFLYVNRFKGKPETNLHNQEVKLIDQHENDTTVASYITFVNDENNKMSMDHEYSNTALLKLSKAISAMAHSTGYVVKADLNQAETDANKITVDPIVITHADNIRKAADILSEALSNLQQAKYPTLASEASAVSVAAQQINPDEMTLDQKNKVKGFFQRSAELLKKMN